VTVKRNVKEKIRRLGKIPNLEKSHELTLIFTKKFLPLSVPLLLTVAVIRGYSWQFVAYYFLKG